MVNIKLVPTWVWIALPLIALLTVGVRQSMQAAYYRGIADDAEQRIELQEIVLDSVVHRSDSLVHMLELADSAVSEQRRINEREVARLTRERREARERTEVISERLRASLDSIQALEFDRVVIGYEMQITKLDSIIVIERETRLAEALRADQASELILSLREVQGELGIKSFMLEAQVAALKQAMKPSLGLRLKADWWLAAVGLAGGYVLWGTR
jgi:septal ring factor EnvC (AmiA/AmiB activator)